MGLIDNTKLMNQIMAVIRSILTTNQISIYEFRDAFIDGKAKLVTLNSNNNFVITPFELSKKDGFVEE